MTRLAVLANTKKISGRDIRDLKQALRRAGFGAGSGHTEWITFDKGSAATKAGKKALKHGADVVLVCGGDGTVRAAAQALVGSEAALAVMPTGTANLFASAMSLTGDAHELVDLIVRGDRRTIDTGTCNGLTFNVMAGTGFDAGMIDAADDQKERLGLLAYLKAGAKEARGREAFAVTVQIDDEPVFDGPASCVLVGNIGSLKGGVEAFPDASPTDGLLNVAVITATGLKAWAGLMVSAVRGRQNLTGHAEMWAGKNIAVRTDIEHRFELDGGVKGTDKRFDFAVVPSSLIVCAPPAAG
jgi:diacylglycerol kinase (ATP)